MDTLPEQQHMYSFFWGFGEVRMIGGNFTIFIIAECNIKIIVWLQIA